MEQVANNTPLWVMKIASQLLFWPTFAWNYLLYIRRSDDGWYSTIVELETGGRLLLGPAPVFKSMRDTLTKTEGVTVFVSTLHRDFTDSSVESHTFPMVDFVSPDLHTVEEAVEYVDERLAAGKTVYVHCKAGKGRSGTIVICWLMKHFGMSPEEAQEYLTKARPQVLKILSKREVVQEYYTKHVASSKKT
ncbi:Phosphatidylglycerophosphatase and protein-tyrosine phosphatase 1 [Perkinsus chesapeaki]|uniref:Phosphatidylglycerophosphatase and protein-tyrosine phosphatase 1 n=1 Tax=Perkinsus chesapeaki TaxID=330153 RepID=A0A7J6LZT9_PERCH|nr:Phosphatidylglycerophosphatase and protein-tyrosine phosphatase 1 [Perkinsus chesapeaki]